jgi:hypothetical protein
MSLQPATPNDYTVPVSDNDWAQMLQSNREAQELLSNAIAHHQEHYEDPLSSASATAAAAGANIKRIGHSSHLHHKSDHYNRMFTLHSLSPERTAVCRIWLFELTNQFIHKILIEEPSAEGQFSEGEGSSGESQTHPDPTAGRLLNIWPISFFPQYCPNPPTF